MTQRWWHSSAATATALPKLLIWQFVLVGRWGADLRPRPSGGPALACGGMGMAFSSLGSSDYITLRLIRAQRRFPGHRESPESLNSFSCMIPIVGNPHIST
jgi:hypothetical protein